MQGLGRVLSDQSQAEGLQLGLITPRATSISDIRSCATSGAVYAVLGKGVYFTSLGPKSDDTQLSAPYDIHQLIHRSGKDLPCSAPAMRRDAAHNW